MTVTRRRVLRAAGAAAALSLTAVLPRRVAAQDWPARPIRWIVSFPAGGGNDIVARLIGQFLGEKLGQQIIIENRAGAGGNVGMAAVLSAPPDGYTIGFAAPNNAIGPSIYASLPFNFMQDSVPVGGTMLLTNVLEVHPSVPARTVGELIALAKANPGKLNFGSSGAGASPHMSGELFKMLAGVDIVHVPYRGGAPALADLIPGRLQIMFDNLTGSIEHIRSGQVRALGVTSTRRSPALPDLPTIGETVPGYAVDVWHGIVAPKGTPPEIVTRLNAALNAVLGDPRLQARFAELGGEALPMTPEQFGKLIAEDTAKWAKVAKAGNIRIE